MHSYKLRLAVTPLILSGVLYACDNAKQFISDDKNDGVSKDGADRDAATEPVMVGGAFLTCGVASSDPKLSQTEIGCRLAERSDDSNARIYDAALGYRVDWLIYDEQRKLVQIAAQQFSDADKWHVKWAYPNSAFVQHQVILEVTARNGRTATYSKALSRLDDIEFDKLGGAQVTYSLLPTSGVIEPNSADDDDAEKNRFPWEMLVLGAIDYWATSSASETTTATNNNGAMSGSSTSTSVAQPVGTMPGTSTIPGFSLQQTAQPSSIDSLLGSYHSEMIKRGYDANLICSALHSGGRLNKLRLRRQAEILPLSPGGERCFMNFLEADQLRRCWFVYVMEATSGRPTPSIRVLSNAEFDPQSGLMEKDLRLTIKRYQCQSR